MKAEAAFEETKAFLDDALMKCEQLAQQLTAMQRKQNVEKREVQKEKEMFKRSTVILAKQKDELKVSVHYILI